MEVQTVLGPSQTSSIEKFGGHSLGCQPRVRKEKEMIFTPDSPSSHLFSTWSWWTARDCHEGFSGLHIRSPGSPRGLPVILDYPW